MRVADAQRLFAPETAYLNTASYGLPPEPAWEAMQRAAVEWRHDLPAEAAARLDAAGVKCASRDGLTRFSFHLSTTEADVDRALEALAGWPG